MAYCEHEMALINMSRLQREVMGHLTDEELDRLLDEWKWTDEDLALLDPERPAHAA